MEELKSFILAEISSIDKKARLVGANLNDCAMRVAYRNVLSEIQKKTDSPAS